MTCAVSEAPHCLSKPGFVSLRTKLWLDIAVPDVIANISDELEGAMMAYRKILTAFAAFTLSAGQAFAAIPSAEEAPVPHLQAAVLAEMAAAPAGDADAVLAAITRATRGVPLQIIVDAVCPLDRANLRGIYGEDQGAISQAQTTLARQEVRQSISETCQIAQLALASYGATGGVPAGGAPGQAFGTGGVGAPGGGGGSGYTN